MTLTYTRFLKRNVGCIDHSRSIEMHATEIKEMKQRRKVSDSRCTTYGPCGIMTCNDNCLWVCARRHRCIHLSDLVRSSIDICTMLRAVRMCVCNELNVFNFELSSTSLFYCVNIWKLSPVFSVGVELCISRAIQRWIYVCTRIAFRQRTQLKKTHELRLWWWR